jgi:hypothetical protein
MPIVTLLLVYSPLCSEAVSAKQLLDSLALPV